MSAHAYPDTPEKRRAGMAAFRAKLLKAHEQVLAEGGLKRKDEERVREYAEAIRDAQRKFGETGK